MSIKKKHETEIPDDSTSFCMTNPGTGNHWKLWSRCSIWLGSLCNFQIKKRYDRNNSFSKFSFETFTLKHWSYKQKLIIIAAVTSTTGPFCLQTEESLHLTQTKVCVLFSTMTLFFVYIILQSVFCVSFLPLSFNFYYNSLYIQTKLIMMIVEAHCINIKRKCHNTWGKYCGMTIQWDNV